ncbi:ribosome biogenesis GTPase Der [Thiofilum flexile]|uniref:ribosome biogenesis GTPase Der n=1 Tax=Thiofilum flexile TaxID=125627 RepID=UPI0003628DE3|nr:ribosome biogenesis GTPase Der [Thiofilum flexile]
MKPVLALIGRPNVGKSTLFNRLTRSRDALVADFPGLTRDRKYGLGELDEREYHVIDTGGLSGEEVGIDEHMAKQSKAAIAEADAVLFIVDGKHGRTGADEMIADLLRVSNKPVFLVINKIDRIDADQAASEFYGFGFTNVFTIAAAHNRGVTSMIEEILEAFPEPEVAEELPPLLDEEGNEVDTEGRIRIAFVGRPNVGKSTLVNRILGEERVIAFDQPGTTRDSIFIPFERDEQAYTLIDTAGMRRRSRVSETVEKFSIIKTMEAIQAAHVVIMLVDAHDAITDQDATLLGMIIDAGRALVLAINKWDGIDTEQRDLIKHQLELKLPFLDFADKHFISAKHGTGVGLLFKSVLEAYDSAMLKVPTSRLTRILETALRMHQPPIINGRRIKLRYAHQGGSNPFLIIIHGNQTEKIPPSYETYLINYFRKTLKLKGTQVKLEFKTGENPYEGKRNTLTPRQIHKKKRLMKFIKKNSK